LKEMIALACTAGEILKNGFGRNHTVVYKGPTDLVTEADHQSEDFLIGSIRRNYPGHAIVSEESGELTGDGNRCWYIDPLDGTINYTHGFPIFSVSIAYAWQGKPQKGVIYQPMTGECFSAERGRGAFLNGRPIHVSATSDLIHALLVTGFPYDLKPARKNLALFHRLSLLTQGVRRLGSGALDFCCVACGSLDGFWELETKPWDIAAGSLIAAEAGALVTDMDGGQNFLQPPCRVVVANPVLHPLLLAELNDGKKEAQ
jgi:myo-inositol-1(or 4)-monophosphatase